MASTLILLTLLALALQLAPAAAAPSAAVLCASRSAQADKICLCHLRSIALLPRHNPSSRAVCAALPSQSQLPCAAYRYSDGSALSGARAIDAVLRTASICLEPFRAYADGVDADDDFNDMRSITRSHPPLDVAPVKQVVGEGKLMMQRIRGYSS